MKPYQHPLTDEALQALDFIAINYMPYPLYHYSERKSFTNLRLSYENDEYIFFDADPLIDPRRVYYKGPIASIGELKQILEQLTGHGRAKTELGREIQDADFISTRSVELIDGVLLAGGGLRWYKISKINQQYKAEFDANDSGFEKATHSLGTFATLREAIKAIYSHR